MEMTYFRKHLLKQLGFLERSCDAFDAGHIDEAIRIATVIRVIIHQTKNSTSLLEHLHAASINLLSTVKEPPKNAIFFSGMGITKLATSKSTYFAPLGFGPFKFLISAGDWWSQVIFVDEGYRVTRNDVVLAASNKDGGAHVDKKLTDEYLALMKDGAVGSIVYDFEKQRVEIPIPNAHLVFLRQMGYELLNSPELINLANSVAR